jgi:hypothetical protein
VYNYFLVVRGVLMLLLLLMLVGRIAVFSRGICRGLNGKIAFGGHVDPSSIVGDSLL